MKRLHKYKRHIAVFLLLVLVESWIQPTLSYALTGGPSQPEVQSFEPAQTDQMVDPFTGDFVYNIPLLDVGGYPINLSYHSGITMDQEASWVGLGWNINPGVINRNMRGLPDDFCGDPITKDYNIQTNWTAGVDLGSGIEFFALPFSLGANMGVFYNNYRGVGFRGGTSFNFSYPLGTKDSKTSGLGANIGLGIQFSSQSGIDILPSVGLSMKNGSEDASNKTSVGLNMGLAYNSRAGLTQLHYGTSVSYNGKSFGPSPSSSISFVNQAVTPTINFPMENFAFTGKLKIGGLLPLQSGDINISGDITGSYSQQKLKYKTETLKGYGYLYMDKSQMDSKALLDFNREKDQPFRKPAKKRGDEGTPVMAIPNYDFDLLSVSGQGISGQFRALRGDIGSVYDPQVQSTSGSGSVNIDLSFGGFVDVGTDFNINVVNTTTSQWVGKNDLHNSLKFYGHDNTLYEPASFVNSGEKTINDQAFYDAIGDVNPVRVKLDGGWFNVHAKRKLQTFQSKVHKSDIDFDTFKKNKRPKRNEVLSYLTASEAQYGALSTSIYDYPVNGFPDDLCGIVPSDLAINRMVQSNNRRNHISEVTVLKPDGNRYVYGIPAYNRVQKDETFSVRNDPSGLNTGVTKYYEGVDNSKDNDKGLEHYFSAEKIPDYSHSFLLTGVLSPDYVDLTGDGISDDDLGTAVKINYSRVFGKNDNDGKGLYRWRVPYERDKANYQQGFKTDTTDDKANYVYGEKEIWYVNSIESKTMVALFRLSDREDGLGVTDENGGKNYSAKLKKLDQIDLYSKSDLLLNGSNAIPIKTVHFKYTYSLCPGIDNNSNAAVDENGGSPSFTGLPNVNGGGKLTLEEVYFTYQRNTKGKLNPYVFHYDLSNNPHYHLKHFDRWGNYKLNSDANIQATETEYQYTIQDKSLCDKYVAAWSLQKIDLPTGGTITVNLESDDYAYVQDRRAMQMFQIKGLGNSTSFSSSDNLYTTTSPAYDAASAHNRFVYVKAIHPVTGSNSSQEIGLKYMEGIKHLYFRCAVKMYPNHGADLAEYVPGYCKVKSYGICPNDNSMIYIELEGDPVGKSGADVVNPITKTAWQFLRINLPQLAYPGSQTNGGGFINVIKAMIAPLFDIQNILMGFSRSCMSRSWCKSIVLSKSWIRLDNPDYQKFGGGARVKQVTISDNWDQMISGEYSATYGQDYDYTMLGPDGKTQISSGVAEYEPLVGGDENPFHQPLTYTEKGKLAPNNEFYIEYPLGETFFPAAGVGYRQVTVRSFGSTQVAPEKRTGYTINKFYTAYDFPVMTDYTPLDPHLDKTPSVFQILQLPMVEHFTGSQGFQVELNDMHGKPRSEEVYNNENTIISRTEYTYKTDNPDLLQKHLNNSVQVLLPDGTISTSDVGKEIELMTDNRHQKTKSFNAGALIDVDVSALFAPWPVPVPIPTVFPSFGYEETQFQSFSAMKVVRRYGILEQVTAQQYGSTVKTDNVVFDSETGEVLLTKTQNEYDDAVYNMTYPAHLAYDGMGPAYKNIGTEFDHVSIVNGHIVSPSSIEDYFTAGDEVLIGRNFSYEKAWVIDPHHTDANLASDKIFIRADGTPYSSSATGLILKIIRSGRRNLASMPIETLVSLSDPVHNDTISPVVEDGVLNTSVTEYKDEWKVNCEKITEMDCDSCSPPSCECIYNLLHTIATNDYWMAQSPDSIFIDQCCLDSCFYSNGTLSTQYCNGCKRHYYTNQTDSTADIFSAVVGRCSLIVHKTDESVFGLTSSREMNSLRVMKPNDVFVWDTLCTTACNYYTITGEYPLLSILSSNDPVVRYAASFTCPSVCNEICVDLSTDQKINPYRHGLLGNWHPYKNWVYRDFRTPDSIAIDGTTNIRYDGIFKSYDPFWEYNSTETVFQKISGLSSKYIDATTITKYNSKGAEIENRDAAGIYSAVQFGYLESQAVAVAKNARYKQIGFDGFEDYNFSTDCSSPCRIDHFNFRENLASGCLAHCGLIDSSEAHTGNYSLKVLSSGSGTVSMERDIDEDTDGSSVVYNTDSLTYILQKDGCLPKFSPDSGRYFITAWIKEAQNCNTLAYTNSLIRVGYTGSSQVDEFHPAGNIIEGWQRLEGSFTVPSGATQIKVDLVAQNGVDVNFDDVRIQPFNSTMKSYVYDWRSLRLMAELDENNFATLYEYDDSGMLIRVKKETERGIMTIQENRSVMKRK